MLLLSLFACAPEVVETGCGAKVVRYYDADGDGFGLAASSVCGDAWGYVLEAGDCDDLDAATFPGADEGCDGRDRDCDGSVAEPGTWYPDNDGDGFGAESGGVSACSEPEGYVTNFDDCDDAAGDVYPGAPEDCDGVDYDCDGVATEPVEGYIDDDGDGYGDMTAAVLDCTIREGYAAVAGDCDNSAADVYPGAPEDCDGVDHDCDGASSLPVTGYPDVDGDSFGDSERPAEACTMPADHVADDTDCDDTQADVYPGAPETCNGEDSDCDGLVSTLVSGYLDSDGDGFGNAEMTGGGCTLPTGYVADGTDCDDTRSDVYPDAPETCGWEDLNCDWMVVAPVTGYLDDDGDGYGDASSIVEACELPTGATIDDSDCDDTRADVYPGAPETCDGVDHDCDESATLPVTGYLDGDGDGYGDDATAVSECGLRTGYLTVGGDCDDANAQVYPGAEEICDSLNTSCDATWVSDAGRATEVWADGTVRDYSAELAAGTDGAPAGVPANNSGELHVCAGTWYVSVSVRPGLSYTIVGHEGAVLDGGEGGPVVSAASGASLGLTDLTIQGAYSLTASAITLEGTGSSLEMTGCVVQDNVAMNGGGILAEGDTTEITITDSTFSGNLAADFGGAIVAGGTLSLTNVDFEGNTAEYGGGVYVGGASSVATMDTVSFLDNEATNYGGAMYVKEGRLDATGLYVSGNNAEAAGGLWLDDSTVAIEDSIITQNTSNAEGGGILAESSVAGASVLLQNTEVTDNDAVLGGGMWINGMPTECVGDSSSDRYGIFANSGAEVYIATTWDLTYTSTSCDYADLTTSPVTEGTVVVLSAGTFSYMTDESFVCTGAGCS